MYFLQKKECPQWMYTIIYLKNLPLLAQIFCFSIKNLPLFLLFCNICIHVGIYCLLMTHTSMITSEISHRFWESPANEVIHSCLFFHVQFFLFSSTSSQTKRCLFYAQTTGSVLIQCLHSDKQCSDWLRVRMHLLQNKKYSHLQLCSSSLCPLGIS